jgi:4-hydroxybenzoate polyprenyltransferase
MYDIIRLLRPLQWFKNVFVLAPLFFSNNLLNGELLWPTLMTFAAFCLVSSSIYCFNDIHDVESDRLHPKKKLRPIAAGKVSVWEGYFIMLLCLMGSLLLATLSHSVNMPIIYGLLLGYWGMNIAYCVRLKQYAILDVAIIAVGFVIRVLIGGFTTDIFVSGWLALMTFLLALFLAFAKRKDDYRIFELTGTMPRKSITGYNAQFIDLSVTIVGTITMVCYIIYTMNEGVIERFGSPYIYLTNFWVLAGLLRYLQNMLVYQRSGSPTKVLVKDRFIQVCIAGWLLSFFAIIYL